MYDDLMEGREWFGFSWSWERWVVGARTYDLLFADKVNFDVFIVILR